MKHANSNLGLPNQEFSYYQNVRGELAEFVDKGHNRILDVGCGAGYFGAYLKSQNRASEVVGIEIDLSAANEAATKLDRVLLANLNQSTINDVLSDFDKASFDYVICADVLEHLIDPWTILAELAAFLKPGGRIIVSLPNVRHWSVWLPLIFKGCWEYRKSGIMDKTHLRFFTRATGLKLISGADIRVIGSQPGIWRNLEQILNQMTFGLCEGLLASQWVIVGKAGLGQ